MLKSSADNRNPTFIRDVISQYFIIVSLFKQFSVDKWMMKKSTQFHVKGLLESPQKTHTHPDCSLTCLVLNNHLAQSVSSLHGINY